MSNDKHHIGKTLTPELIEKYLAEELSHTDMHLVEKLMLTSAFDEEAMEGYEATGAAHMANDLDNLQHRIDEKIKQQQRLLPLWLKIAASLLLLASATFIIFNVDTDTADTIALKETSKEKPTKAPTAQKKSAPQEDNIQENVNSTGTGEKEYLIAPQHESKARPTQQVPTPRTEVLREVTKPTEPVLMEAPPEITSDMEIVATEEEPEAILKGNVMSKETHAVAEGAVQKPSTNGIRLNKKQAYTRTTAPNVTGTITSTSGEPLPGVNIIEKESRNGTVTDAAGKFQLSLDAPKEAVLIISFIGYTTSEVTVAGRTEVNITITESLASLNEVVVTGYANTIKSKDSAVDILRARPKEGMAAFKKYVKDSLRHPEPNKSNTAKVVIDFEVLPSGQLTNFQVIKSEGTVYDQEAIRLIKEGPQWEPSTRNGIAEKDKVRIRIRF